MKKYLFTDGINGVKELLSQEELQMQVESAPYPDKIRIWLFSSNEWISYETFMKRNPSMIRKEKASSYNKVHEYPVRTGKDKHWLKKLLMISGAASGAFLIFNFTKIKWTKAAPVRITAARPTNVPVIDIDSLIKSIEDDRGVLLDRYKRTNLRLRNSWPDRIELQLNSDKETGSSISRYFNIQVSIDNSTGFNLDDAVVKLRFWKNGRIKTTDTLRFKNIRYDKLSTRKLHNTYRGDSIAVSFESIRAKSFNFCYSSTVKNDPGNYNDRWFCRE